MNIIRNNKLAIIFAIIVVAFISIALIRFSTPEDDWICNKGEWVKHGNPSAPMPTSLCNS